MMPLLWRIGSNAKASFLSASGHLAPQSALIGNIPASLAGWWDDDTFPPEDTSIPAWRSLTQSCFEGFTKYVPTSSVAPWRTQIRHPRKMSLLVPKNRKPKFRVHLSIQDLTNVPLVSGLVHVRWHLQDSIRSEARGKTERSPIQDHKVEWGYENSWIVKMVIDKGNNLQEAIIDFEVYQEMYGGKERHALGKLDLNLAEYAGSSEVVSTRYLLQNSKVNSTLKLSIYLEQLSGDTDFAVPEMKKAQVFGGITGILSDGKDIKKRDEEYGSGHDNTADRVAMQLEQDVYRDSILRRWQEQAGELNPASVVEDIFNGSDGWVKPHHHHHHHQHHQGGGDDDDNDDGRESRHRRQHPHKPHVDYLPQKVVSRMGPGEGPRDLADWSVEKHDFEADEMLRSLSWTIDPKQVARHVGKSLEQRQEELTT
ncbi:protein of unknown function [Taphrina deformans PYCC 5710]|uniref:C2 NT-type domain-containing protein n=1 Tax=Taphrina deformans (strain PYCC 5710 / ATCC 11124 / CBS 356.35 / IMI 108563 / JCM 9778 / NBRC 8474) TaxID=1097556 RepID=R4XDI9_TAPDE|nr:protein of unknown function [Taphrina deformans PYCC 5710]|eukprot:CCG83946.1 protein of unknown function [Taphrina deformans PYCC 5710]